MAGVAVPLPALLACVTPWDAWTARPLSRPEVQRAFDAQATCEYLPDEQERAGKPGPRRTRDYHIRRIAHLMRVGWNDPIQVDVGVPGAGLTHATGAIVTDGYHRLAAACLLGHATIHAEISGCTATAQEILGVKP